VSTCDFSCINPKNTMVWIFRIQYSVIKDRKMWWIITSNGHMMDQKFVYVVHNIKHLWVIMWHIFTSTNNTTTILFPTQLWELLYIYHVIKQCTEKETTSLSNVLLTIKLNYLHDLKIMSCFSVYYILICTCRYGWILISCLNWKLQ
jgi:hypothetical protein